MPCDHPFRMSCAFASYVALDTGTIKSLGFDDKAEYDAYVQAFEGETQRAQQFAESLGMGSTPVQPWQTGRG